MSLSFHIMKIMKLLPKLHFLEQEVVEWIRVNPSPFHLEFNWFLFVKGGGGGEEETIKCWRSVAEETIKCWLSMNVTLIVQCSSIHIASICIWNVTSVCLYIFDNYNNYKYNVCLEKGSAVCEYDTICTIYLSLCTQPVRGVFRAPPREILGGASPPPGFSKSEEKEHCHSPQQ